jgi:regulatory protein
LDKVILKKICSFCAYQERTQDEARKKLSEWKVFSDEAEEIIAWLIVENFINEERFAKIFAGGKFRIKNWGRKKIIFELKSRKLSPYCIQSGLLEISEEDYIETIDVLIKKKSDSTNESNSLIKKQKIANYLIGKGYESELIWSRLNEIKKQ